MEHEQTPNVCHWCVRDTYLAKELLDRGKLRECSYCFVHRKTFPLDELAERIHDVISRHFRLTPNGPVEPEEFVGIALGRDWERTGCSPEDLVVEVVGIDQEIAGDIVQLLSNAYGWRLARHGDEDPYHYEARHEELGPHTGPFWSIWESVPNSIQHRARYFNTDAESVLSRLFSELHALRTRAGEAVVQVVGTDTDDTFIWRARRAGSEGQLKTILANPTAEMGPPPPESAPAGRMNAAGIPVFYGALDQGTCIAEIRPPVGSYVVTGKFQLLKTVRLLDLNLLQDVTIETSYFDPQYADRSNRVAFLKQLGRELTKPVMPEDETREYIATQVIAEYLAHKVQPRIDGIFFRSSQTDPPGENVVLFNHACEVERFVIPPGINVQVGNLPESDVEDENPVVDIWEFGVPEPQASTSTSVGCDIQIQEDGTNDRGRLDHDPTLKLDVHGLTVHRINAIKPEYTSLKTERHQGEFPVNSLLSV